MTSDTPTAAFDRIDGGLGADEVAARAGQQVALDLDQRLALVHADDPGRHGEREGKMRALLGPYLRLVEVHVEPHVEAAGSQRDAPHEASRAGRVALDAQRRHERAARLQSEIRGAPDGSARAGSRPGT